MSRIGKKVIEIPAGVKVAVKDHTVEVQGPKGKLSFTARPEVAIAVADGGKAVNVGLSAGFTRDNKEANAYWGTTRALVRNMVEGVTKGYEKNMEVIGVGWVAAVQGKKLKLNVGFANSIMMDIPDGVSVTVEKEKVKIVGTDKQVVGQFASEMRAKRKPEPYNGKGIKYAEEVIKRKQGKQFGA